MKGIKKASPVLTVCLGIGFLFCIPGIAAAVSFGVASDYNEFFFQNISQSYTDSQGRVAAGGNVDYLHMSVASDLRGAYPLGDLVVGGNLSWQHGSVGYLGNANDPSYKQGSIFMGGVSNIDQTVTYGSLTQGRPIDFSSAQTSLSESSRYWAGLAATGTTQITPTTEVTPRNLITLMGTNPTLNIFNLDGDVLMNAARLDINTPSGSTALVNIDGTQGAMQNFGFFLSGADDPYILYNFYEATALTFGAIEIHGSVLAPGANINFSNGHIEGQLIGLSLFGTGEAHNEPFRGNLPAAAVPEPSTLLLLGTGIASVVLWGRKQSRSSKGVR